MSGDFTAWESQEMLPITGVSAIATTSSGDLSVVSSNSRSTATPKPSRSPSTAARPRLRSGSGEKGADGSEAFSETVALIGAAPPPSGVSYSLMTLVIALA